MSININSEASCRKAYLNYHCYGNTMNISAEEMGEITRVWEKQLTSWQKTVSKDENQYEFDDSDYSSYKDNGRKQAQEDTGYSGDDTGNKINGIVSSDASAISAAGSTVSVCQNAIGITSTVSSLKSNILAPGRKYNGALDQAGGKNTKLGKASAYIAAGLAIATATMYRIMKPNSDETKACEELVGVMDEKQLELQDSKADMENMANELIDLSDEANDVNDEANTTIEEEKTKFDIYKAQWEALKAKAESGEPLSEEEKELYSKLCEYMAENAENITSAQDDATDVVGEIYDDMGTYQEGYDNAAETMGEVEGTTDFAAGFDVATRNMCIIEGSSQLANAASGAVAGAQLMGMGFWNWALGVASIAAGILSAAGAAEQFSMVGKVKHEIGVRENTQVSNVETRDVYDKEIDAYAGFMQGVEDLELEIPDDLEVPQDTTLPPTSDGYPNGTPDEIKSKQDEE